MRTAKNRKLSYKKGVFAERVASLFLRLKGYQVLRRRFKTPFGEVDLILKKKTMIIAVEVKARTTYAMAVEAISLKQKQRVEKALLYYLKRMPQKTSFDIRFDAILILPWSFPKHIKGAWESL